MAILCSLLIFKNLGSACYVSQFFILADFSLNFEMDCLGENYHFPILSSKLWTWYISPFVWIFFLSYSDRLQLHFLREKFTAFQLCTWPCKALFPQVEVLGQFTSIPSHFPYIGLTVAFPYHVLSDIFTFRFEPFRKLQELSDPWA